nr:uncharacterized protein LOC117995682 [Maniola hyperantus]
MRKVLTPHSYSPNSIVFKIGMCEKACRSGELEEAKPATFTSTRSRYVLSQNRCQAADNMLPQARARAPRSRSSPERISDPQRPRRTRSPSTTGLPATAVCTPPAILSPLLYNAPGAVALYSPRPPSAPMYLIPLPPNPKLLNGTKTKTQFKPSVSF